MNDNQKERPFDVEFKRLCAERNEDGSLKYLPALKKFLNNRGYNNVSEIPDSHADAYLQELNQQFNSNPEVPTNDPLVKLIRSLKVIRKEAMAETPEAKQELVDAALDVAATFIIGIYQQGQHLERISHALIAQTHLLAAVYSTGDSPEETAKRVAAAGAEMDANLAKMG